MVTSSLRIAFTVATLCYGSVAFAQWSDDPAVNQAIADRNGEQVVQKVARLGGSTYIGWFDQASGNYDLYLQRLDVHGVEQWPHNGILISDHPQNSSLVDWDLIVDFEGNAVLVFSDARDGSDLDIHAYRVSPDGTQLWGADGVTLSSNDDFEPAPRVTPVIGDGFVVVWPRLPSGSDGDIRMQRLSEDGVPQLAPGGVPIISEPGESPAFADVSFQFFLPDPGGAITSGDNDVFVSWIRDITNFGSDRHLRFQRFTPDAVPVWPAVDVYDAGSLPIGYHPDLNSTAQTALVWHVFESGVFKVRYQVISWNGDEIFPHNGIELSTSVTRNHLDPVLTYDIDIGATVFWNERNLSQTAWGIYGQRIKNGVKQWGDEGLELVPVDGTFKAPPQTQEGNTGFARVAWIERQGTSDRVMAMSVASGTVHWGPNVLSSVDSDKSRLVVAGGNKTTIAVWEDDRNGDKDIYLQNVNVDGSLGDPPTTNVPPGPAPRVRLQLAQNRPNPFASSTSIALTWEGEPGAAHVRVLDVLGRQVRVLPVPLHGAIVWDGRDQQGRDVADGVYFYGVDGGPMQKAIVVR